MTSTQPVLAAGIDFTRPLSLRSMLGRAVGAVPGATALVGSAGRLDYRALDEMSNRVASVLGALGVQAGDRVAVSLPNDVPIVVALTGVWKLGAVYVGVHRALATPEKEFFLDDSGAVVLLADEVTARELGRGRAARQELREIVLVEPGSAADEWQERLDAAAPDPVDTTVDPLALAAI